MKALGEATLVERNLRDALPVDVEAVVQHFKRLEGNDTHKLNGRRFRLPKSNCRSVVLSEKLVPTRPRASQRKDHFPRQ